MTTLADIDRLADRIAALVTAQDRSSDFWDMEDIAYHLRASKSTAMKWATLYLETDLPGFYPLSGADCALGYVVGSARLGVIPSEGIYPTLGSGFYASAMANEMSRTSNASAGVSQLSFTSSSDVYPSDIVTLNGVPDGKSLIGCFINGVFYTEGVSLVGSLLTLDVTTGSGYVPAGSSCVCLFG